MSLKDSVTIVSGASGNVASAIAVEFLKQGAKVWVPLRNEKRFDDLKTIVPKELHGNLRFFKSDLENEAEFHRLRDEALKKDGKVHHVVSCFGGFEEVGPLSELSFKDYKQKIEYNLYPHFLLYTTFAKVLSKTPKSTFISIQGAIPEDTVFMFPNASFLPIKNLHLAGEMVSAKAEFNDNPNIRIIQYRIASIVFKQPDSQLAPEQQKMGLGHDYVAKFVPKMIKKHKSDIYLLFNRQQGEQLSKSLD